MEKWIRMGIRRWWNETKSNTMRRIGVIVEKYPFGLAIMHLEYANRELAEAISGASSEHVFKKSVALREALDDVNFNSTRKGISPIALRHWDESYVNVLPECEANLGIAERQTCSSLRLVVS
jgi:hypothetical protein